MIEIVRPDGNIDIGIVVDFLGVAFSRGALYPVLAPGSPGGPALASKKNALPSIVSA